MTAGRGASSRRPDPPRRLRAVGLCVVLALSAAGPAAPVSRLAAQSSPTPESTPATPGDPRGWSSAAEVRALWVQRGTLSDPASIATMVRTAQAAGFNTLLVQVRGRGDAFFSGGIDPRAEALAGQPESFDPLATVLALARGAGLAVHAWINVNLIASEPPISRQHVLHRHPEWMMVPRALARTMATLDPASPAYAGTLVRYAREHADQIEGVYLSPIHEDARVYTVSVVEDIVRRYDLDGVHFDYLRYPNDEFDYSREALARFRREVVPDLAAAQQRQLDARLGDEPTLYADLLPERWSQFRREQLTGLLAVLRDTIRTRRPDAIVSAAVFPDADDAYRARLQDWAGWGTTGLLDVLCPMAYTADRERFESQVASVRARAGRAAVWAGIGAYRLSATQTVDRVTGARNLGTHGVVLFSYDNFVDSPERLLELTDIGREAFPPS